MFDAGVTRLFYKDLHAMSVTSLNVYMVRINTFRITLSEINCSLDLWWDQLGPHWVG